MLSNIKSLTSITKEIFDYLGLSKFEAQINISDYSTKYYCDLRYSLERNALFNKSDKDLVETFLKPITDDIKNSEFIKDITEEYTVKIKDLEKTKDAALKEILRLKEFETYYNLTYSLQHGKKE